MWCGVVCGGIGAGVVVEKMVMTAVVMVIAEEGKKAIFLDISGSGRKIHGVAGAGSGEKW